MHDAFADREIEKKIFYRANTDDDEEDMRNDTFLKEYIHTGANQISKRKKSRLYNFSEDAADPVGNKAFSVNADDDDVSMIIQLKKRQSIRRPTDKKVLNYDEEDSEDHTSPFEILNHHHHDPHHNNSPRSISPCILHFSIFENLSKKSSFKIKSLRGDIHKIPEFDDLVFLKTPVSLVSNYNTESQNLPTSPMMSHAKRVSNISKYMPPVEDLKIIRERNPTPTATPAKDRASILKNNDVDVKMKRTYSKERLSSLSSPKNGNENFSKIINFIFNRAKK